MRLMRPSPTDPRSAITETAKWRLRNTPFGKHIHADRRAFPSLIRLPSTGQMGIYLRSFQFGLPKRVNLLGLKVAEENSITRSWITWSMHYCWLLLVRKRAAKTLL